MPVNLTNPIDVAGGQPAVYRARPTCDLPAMHPNNATAAVVSIYRKELQRNSDYAMAESALLTVLLASIGDTNTDLLATTFPGISRPYALTSRLGGTRTPKFKILIIIMINLTHQRIQHGKIWRSTIQET